MAKNNTIALIALACALSVANARAEYTDDCITFSSGASFSLKVSNGLKNWDGTLWTSTDKMSWTEWNGVEVAAAQAGGAGNYNLHVRGNTSNTKITGSMDSSGAWITTGTVGISCTGNIETLRGAIGNAPSPTPMAYSCYHSLFSGCTLLTTAPALSATTLTNYCYERMFNDCTSLTTAPALPATTLATRCYKAMFFGCTSLKESPALPATTLASSCYSEMFYRCTSLTDIPVLPATTLAYGCYWCMFADCAALEVNVDAPGVAWKIPATTGSTDWGTSMFYGTKGTLQGRPDLNTTYYIASALVPEGGPYKETVAGIEWTYVVDADLNASVGSGTSKGDRAVQVGTSGVVVIPSVLGGRDVKSVGNYAFYDRNGLVDVTIPSGVTNIGNYAFYRCFQLQNVSIPSSVSSIGNDVFYSCQALTSVTIPVGLISIGDNLFYACQGLTNVTMPSTVTSIGADAFSGCSSLTSLAIPEAVTNIGAAAFYGCKRLTGLKIPEGVTSISTSTFSYCSGLKEITIPKGVTTIGMSAFYSCSGLTNLKIPEGVTNIGSYAFRSCGDLTNVTVAASVAEIGEWAFRNCCGLKNVTFGGNAPSVGLYAFDDVANGCTATVKVGTSGWNASGGSVWWGLTLVWVFPDGGPYTETKDGVEWTFMIADGMAITGQMPGRAIPQTTQGTVKIPSSLGHSEVRAVGNQSFYNCSALAGVTIPSVVTNIGDYAFSCCSKLENIEMPVGVTCIGREAFANCGITNVTIPMSVKVLGEGAFYYCSRLTKVSISDGVPYIAQNAFSYCTSLERVEIPSSVTTIGIWAFSNCSGLTEVAMANGVTSIMSSAFSGCSKLTCASLPSTLTLIGPSAFYGCYELAYIRIPLSVETIGMGAFASCSALDSLDFEGPPPYGVANANIRQNAAIRYNSKYESEWLPVIVACGWTNAKPYTPGKPNLSESEIQDWVVRDLGVRFAKPGESPEQYQTRFEAKFGKNYTAAFDMETGKVGLDNQPLCVWQDYVAGTDPLDQTSKFKASITFDDTGTPIVEWDPDLNDDGVLAIRKYTTYGCENIGSIWQDMNAVPEADKSNYRFFKVTVEMP